MNLIEEKIFEIERDFGLTKTGGVRFSENEIILGLGKTHIKIPLSYKDAIKAGLKAWCNSNFSNTDFINALDTDWSLLYLDYNQDQFNVRVDEQEFTVNSTNKIKIMAIDLLTTLKQQ